MVHTGWSWQVGGAGAVEPEAELDTRELEQVGARVGVVENVGPVGQKPLLM